MSTGRYPTKWAYEKACEALWARSKECQRLIEENRRLKEHLRKFGICSDCGHLLESHPWLFGWNRFPRHRGETTKIMNTEKQTPWQKAADKIIGGIRPSGWPEPFQESIIKEACYEHDAQITRERDEARAETVTLKELLQVEIAFKLRARDASAVLAEENRLLRER